MAKAPTTYRLDVVDALRGFALVSIMLLHNIEHFDVYYKPSNLPAWMIQLDTSIWDSLFFLFGGKSYAIFALLFGLTFYIQSHNQEKKGKDFRMRFTWRLLLLFAFGILNSMFYQGDILTLYAFIGFFLIPFAKLSDKWVFACAVLFLLQPFEWVHLFKAIQHPDITVPNPVSWTYFGKMDEYIKNTSFLNTLIGNLTNGKTAVIYWSWENGRFFHILALFMLGMLAGRRKLFVWSDTSKNFWKKTLLAAVVAFLILFTIQKNMNIIIASEATRRPLSTIETSWSNISFMLILVSLFFLLFHTHFWNKKLNVFSPIGRMSLSNYIFQSILGSTIYYGFGLALYQYTGATYSLMIGIALAILLGYFSWWWLKNHKRGPLEEFWHKATWIEQT